MRWLARKFAAPTVVAIIASGCTTPAFHSTGTPVEYVTRDILDGEWSGTSKYSWMTYRVNRTGSYKMHVEGNLVRWESIYNAIRRNGTSSFVVRDGVPYYNDYGYRKVAVTETPDGFLMRWELDRQKETIVPFSAIRTVYRPKTPADLARKKQSPPANATPVEHFTEALFQGTWSGSTRQLGSSGATPIATELEIKSSVVTWAGPKRSHQRYTYISEHNGVANLVDFSINRRDTVEVFETRDKYLMRWYPDSEAETVVYRAKRPDEMAKP